MKLLISACCFLLASLAGYAQVKSIPLDKSPLDVCYFPDNYPMLKIQGKATDPLMARVIYSRPNKGDRQVFGELIAYGKLWRLGANEATEIEFFQNVKIGNDKVKKGRYTMYSIPEAGKWTVIFNKENDTWGSFGYDAKKDVAKITVPVQLAVHRAVLLTEFQPRLFGCQADAFSPARGHQSFPEVVVKM
jgi:hypothetical protein